MVDNYRSYELSNVSYKNPWNYPKELENLSKNWQKLKADSSKRQKSYNATLCYNFQLSSIQLLFLAQELLLAKLIIRDRCSKKLEWDAGLPEKKKWIVSKVEYVLKYLDILNIVRGIGYGLQQNCTIHVFCEVIDKAHATGIFLLCEDKLFA